MNFRMACLAVAALAFVQAALAADVLPPSPALSPEALKAELEQELAALGVPTTDVAGKILPGANLVQINGVLNNILNARLTEAFQRSTQEVNQNTQAVLVALANPSTVNALSPSARTQYETVVDLFKNPTFANPPVTAASIGRKLLFEA